ncbi:MAG TPA: winged helix DNA-binding domain-containing protein [Candidatus Limnocylindria bacterium]|nr:winged helix DNA-binding domain-containing protein [Candidatus Limnocylindria bacterium]
MTARDLNRATLARQGLLEPIRGAPADAVRRIGSLQAQHPEWPPVALATRAASARTANLARALADRKLVRSSLMRLTIHVVDAADLWPMFRVVQPLRLNQWRLLLKADPVTSPLGKRMTAAHAVAMDALREGPKSSLELDRLMAAEVGPAATATTRPTWRQPQSQIVVRAAWRHFAAFVPLVHVPWQGEGYGRSQYLLAEDWLGVDGAEPDDTADRVHLARRYFSAFGPASVEDLVAYVGRGKGGIGIWRDAVSALHDELVEVVADDGRTLYDMADAPRPGADVGAPPRLLARWDSLLLSHATKHRQRVIADAHRAAVFTKNADVRPTFLIDGFVAGTWDLARGEGKATLTLVPFARLPRSEAAALEAEADRVLQLVAPTAADRSVRIQR